MPGIKKSEKKTIQGNFQERRDVWVMIILKVSLSLSLSLPLIGLSGTLPSSKQQLLH